MKRNKYKPELIIEETRFTNDPRLLYRYDFMLRDFYGKVKKKKNTKYK